MPTSIKRIESITDILPKQKAENRSSLVISTKLLEGITLILDNCFQRIETEEIFPNFFYDGSITLIPKPGKTL